MNTTRLRERNMRKDVIDIILRPNKREQFLPIPVALISTVDTEGNRNIAPSANVMPVLKLFDSVAVALWLRRDTLDNIRDTKEFVINIVDEAMIRSGNHS